MPRVSYLNNSNGSLILEPQRTNLLPYSDLSSGFTTTNVTLSNNQGTSPDGTSNATKALMASGTGTHRVYDAINSSLNDDNVLSVFIKEQNDITHIGLNADTMSSVCWFSGLDGSIINANGLDAKTESFGNGWHRISVYYVADANDAGDNQFIYFSNRENPSPNVPFDGTEEILLYGIQAEKGSYPTTLINTSGSSVTRNADGCELTNASDSIGQTEGTIFLDITRDSLESYTQRVFTLSDGTTSNIIGFQLTASNQINFYVENGGTNQVIITKNNATTANVNVKIAAAYKENDFVLYIDGTQVGVDTSGSVPTTSVIKYANANGSFQYVGSVNNTKIYNTRLSNSELATLTTL